MIFRDIVFKFEIINLLHNIYIKIKVGN
jgi:hypothetical protein